MEEIKLVFRALDDLAFLHFLVAGFSVVVVGVVFAAGFVAYIACTIILGWVGRGIRHFFDKVAADIN